MSNTKSLWMAINLYFGLGVDTCLGNEEINISSKYAFFFYFKENFSLLFLF